LFIDEKESKRSKIEPCIRCGKCVYSCPQGLEAYLLSALSDHKRFEECEIHGVLNCTECGSCSYICPANRPILDNIRIAKSAVMASKNRK